MSVQTWNIFYSDGSTFSSKDGSWEEAPSKGVQVVKLFFKKTSFLHYNYDYYWRIEDIDEIVFGRCLEMYKNILVPRNIPTGGIKEGSLIDDQKFASILKKAKGSKMRRFF